jgi:hypothetical protein
MENIPVYYIYSITKTKNMLDQLMEQNLREATSPKPVVMMSLFDYLKKPAGVELGKQVAEYAKIRKVVIGSRTVDNPKYKGNILTYTQEFLDEFFKTKSVIETNR